MFSNIFSCIIVMTNETHISCLVSILIPLPSTGHKCDGQLTSVLKVLT